MPPRRHQHPTHGLERPKTLYIREDHLVDEISIRLGDEGNDGRATSEFDRLRHGRVAAALRESGKIIVYDGAELRLEETDSS
ncbi:hypothetical protein [Amycolatopsis sp. MtRt-6]|uniref:hypothetical protein n=1 Tax=Amycolatopsis sp. MtRt-6 TaxID=2792782 RepID=UPI001A8EC489|nr:hypothetical protein [Amycolatopsis sp. MtRt-6]